MEIQGSFDQKELEEIILSWHPQIDIKKVKIIELKDSMISYMYNWVVCLCENKLQEDSINRALLARIAETRFLVEESAMELWK